ncbi:hypothetical protein [Pseudoduganella sp. R-34]|uniref:hypothetical protein n=1 Tax=unclassified Pseudoduganella TaxID=2637179 RepID=UPI003CED99F9
MSYNNPLSRFVSGFGNTLQNFDKAMNDLSPSDPAQQKAYVAAFQEVQMAVWAAKVATQRRHSLLSKIMTEIR